MYRGAYRVRRKRSADGRCTITGRFTAIVAEKPKAGRKIAEALGRPRTCRYNGIPYWILSREGRTLVVVPSAGHLFGPHSDKRGFPVYEMEWRPLYEFDREARHTRKFYMLMQRILPRASFYINACDYDIEGSVIGYTIIEHFGDVKRYRRMRFSSLSPVEIRRAYENLEPPDTLLVEAGKARHEVDWLWGINVSRALMHAVRAVTGKRIILSAGRVQSPTIVEAAKRWEKINLAVPLPEFSLTVVLAHGEDTFQASPDGWKPRTAKEARAIAKRLRLEGELEVSDSSRARSASRPPPAFNLGDLQKEAARIYGFSPMKTQRLAEDLYLDALISYPRTNSQKLPPTIDYAGIIRSLARAPRIGELARKLLDETGGVLRPVQGVKDDPAHPAIHPTGEIPRGLDRDHWAIYELITRRFFAAFASKAIVSRVRLSLLDGEGARYAASGVEIEAEGWMAYYYYSMPREQRVPLLPPGTRVRIVDVKSRMTWARSVPELSRTSLLVWMEKERIGTEATRARIIETLFKRGYLAVRGGKTIVTDLGMMVAGIIEELFPELSRPDLTRRLEEKLESIQKGLSTRRRVVEETIRELDALLRAYRERLREVGERLAYSLGLKEPPQKCPICGRMSYEGDPHGLCRYHSEALRRLFSALPEIALRLGVGEVEALRRVARLRGSAGKWVIEAASFALERGLTP